MARDQCPPILLRRKSESQLETSVALPGVKKCDGGNAVGLVNRQWSEYGLQLLYCLWGGGHSTDSGQASALDLNE